MTLTRDANYQKEASFIQGMCIKVFDVGITHSLVRVLEYSGDFDLGREKGKRYLQVY